MVILSQASVLSQYKFLALWTPAPITGRWLEHSLAPAADPGGTQRPRPATLLLPHCFVQLGCGQRQRKFSVLSHMGSCSQAQQEPIVCFWKGGIIILRNNPQNLAAAFVPGQ